MRWRRRSKSEQGRPERGRPSGPPERSRIDRALFPVFGPAQVGPYDEPEREYVPVDEECSICFRLMSQHTADRSGGRSRIVCPPLTAGDVRALGTGR